MFWQSDHTDSKVIPILNPNQKLFLDDEKRYKARLEMLAASDPNDENLFVRTQKTEEDSYLLDKHDSFYHTTKSLLVLFQIMGVMPIHRNKDGLLPRTLYVWISKVFFWALLVFSIESFLVGLVLHERVEKFLKTSDKKFDEIIYNVIFISILFTHFLVPIASWRHGSEVAIFKNMWTTYQLKFLRVTKREILFPNLYPLTWALCFLSWGISIGIVLSQYYLQPDFELWYTFAYYHIFAMLNGFCSLWYINCTAFGTASRALEKFVQQTLETEKPADKLTELRHLWVDLSHMMQQLGRAYSNMYGIYCLVIFFTTIIATYGAFSEIIDHGATYKEFGLFVIVIYCMTLLFIICNEAHHASQSVGLDFQTRLLNVNLTAVDSATQKEVEMFLIAIDKNPPTMNLDGYANINRKLITSNITFMATYLVVLLQFKLTLLRKTKLQAAALQKTQMLQMQNN